VTSLLASGIPGLGMISNIGNIQLVFLKFGNALTYPNNAYCFANVLKCP
jgi:hypothetical protein